MNIILVMLAMNEKNNPIIKWKLGFVCEELSVECWILIGDGAVIGHWHPWMADPGPLSFHSTSNRNSTQFSCNGLT